MTCKNCKKSLEDSYDYCNNCGAKVIRNRLTIRNLFEHFIDQFLSIDNRFLRTFITLFKSPEKVIGDYITGTRKKYVNVISYFAIALTLAGFYIFIYSKYFPDLMAESATIAIDDSDESQNEMALKTVKFVFEYMSIIMVAFIPFLAITSRLIFLKNKKFNFTEHLVINLYTYAHLSITLTILNLLIIYFESVFIFFSILSMPIQILYFAYVLKKLYKLNLSQIILKTLLFLMIFAILFVLLSIIMAVIMFLNGSMDELIEAEKAKQGISHIVSSTINWTS